MTPEPLKILLVEDNPADARLVQEMLRQVAVPFQLTHVASLEAANATLAPGITHLTTPAAVVLLDLSLPDAQGLEAVSRLCSVHPHVPIVVMSDLDDEAIALQALQLGAQDYLVKGQTDAQLLVRAVRYAIERFSRLRRELLVQIELRDSKEAAEAGSRAKSEFLATMSHELRTPLHAIMGLSQLLEQEFFGSLNAKQKEYLTCIHSSGEHLLELINDILDLSKVEAGKEELTRVPLDVRELCDYAVTIVRDRAEEKGLQLTSEVDPQVDVCIGDQRRVKQMLLNLLTNAIKFTPAGRVSLRIQKVPHGIAFTVADTGIGIAPEQIKLLFQPFKQLDSRLNRQYEGTGLGLALTRKLARLHGGDVTVQSTLGEGSQFTLFLPYEPQETEVRSQESGVRSQKSGVRSQESEENPSPGDWHQSPGSSPRILIVEDDRRSAMLLQDYLEAIGYQVEHLAEAKSFLERVRSFKPNLILLDVQLLDGVTGFDLLLCLRREPDLQNLPVVMVTEMAMAGERERFLEAGANDYLSKPIGIAQIESILMEYL